MNAPEAFARCVEWLIVWTQSFRLKEIRKNLSLIKEKQKSEYDLQLSYQGDLVAYLKEHNDELLNNEAPERPLHSYTAATLIRLDELFFWSWYVRKIYSFDIKSQSGLRHIDISGVDWSQIYVPFPVIFVEFQAEFFVFGREYDSVMFREVPKGAGDEFGIQVVFFSRKRSENLPDAAHHKVLWTKLCKGNTNLFDEKSYSDDYIENHVFLFMSFSLTSESILSNTESRGIQMCLRALLVIIHHEKKTSCGSDGLEPKDGEILPPEQPFKVDIEKVLCNETVAQDCIKLAEGRKSPRTHTREKHERHLRDGRVIKVSSAIVNKHKMDLIPTTRVHV